MRATDDRYRGEQARFELALRMIKHEARTGTIRFWTGVNDDRIRKLYSTYFKFGDIPVRRRRGRSPTRIGPLVRTPTRALESGLFANLLLANGLFSVDSPPGSEPQGQHRLGASLLRMLRDVRPARAARGLVLRVGLEPADQHPARRRARHCALRRLLDLLRVRSPVAASIRLPRVPGRRGPRRGRALHRGRAGVSSRDVSRRRRAWRVRAP